MRSLVPQVGRGLGGVLPTKGRAAARGPAETAGCPPRRCPGPPTFHPGPPTYCPGATGAFLGAGPVTSRSGKAACCPDLEVGYLVMPAAAQAAA